MKLKHSKQTYLMIALLGAIMWILGGWNTDNGDFSNYEEMYTNDFLMMTLSSTPDYGFFLILELFKNIGFTLIQFRIVIYLVFILLLIYTTLKFCRRPLLVFFIYFLISFFRDVITLRNTVAMIFLIIGIMFLMSEKMKYKKFKFSVCILLSSSIHISFLFYFVLLFYDFKINIRLYALGAVILSFMGKPILEMLSSYVISDDNGQAQSKVENLLSSGSYASLIICSITILLTVYMCKQSYSYLVKREDNLLNYTIYRINVALLCLIVLTSISMLFIRLFYNVLLFDLIIMANVVSYKKKLDVVAAFWLLWIYVWMFWMSNVPNNVFRILSNNLLL